MWSVSRARLPPQRRRSVDRRRPQGWDLNLSLVRDDLDDAAVAVLEHQFPGLGVRLTAAAQPGAVGHSDGGAIAAPRCHRPQGCG